MPSVSASSSRGEVHLPRAAGTFPSFCMGELLGETAVTVTGPYFSPALIVHSTLHGPVRVAVQ